MSDNISRRQFVATAALCGGGLIAGGLTLSGCGGTSSFVSDRKQDYDIPFDGVSVVYKSDGIILSNANGKIFAHSMVCPHFSCNVEAETDMLHCKCHHSKFNLDGSRIEGPSKRGLDRFPVKVENGKAVVSFSKFYKEGNPEYSGVFAEYKK